jgi:hypothetical protein
MTRLRTSGPPALCLLVLALAPLLARSDGQGSLAAPALPAEVPSSAVLHSVLMSGNAAGTQATWRGGDGKVHVFFA